MEGSCRGDAQAALLAYSNGLYKRVCLFGFYLFCFALVWFVSSVGCLLLFVYLFLSFSPCLCSVPIIMWPYAIGKVSSVHTVIEVLSITS